MAKSIVVTLVRKSAVDGRRFKSVEVFPHQPMHLQHDVAGWSGMGAGLSQADLQRIFDELIDTASNVHKIKIELINPE